MIPQFVQLMAVKTARSASSQALIPPLEPRSSESRYLVVLHFGQEYLNLDGSATFFVRKGAWFGFEGDFWHTYDAMLFNLMVIAADLKVQDDPIIDKSRYSAEYIGHLWRQ